jgi:DNA-binding NarL/FixJ family response regulator
VHAVAAPTCGRLRPEPEPGHREQAIVKGAPLTSETPKRRILIVDDHAIVRLGMRQLIAAEPDLSICCEAETAEQALALARNAKADLAIVDLSLGTVHGLELVRQLHQALPDLPVLVLSMHDETLFALRALRAGARGYIMKTEAIEGLIKAVRQVLAGKIHASERVSQELLEGLGHRGSSPAGPLGGLTDRELEVFEMIGRGLSTAGIAEQLGISVKTIETYRSNIRTKLNLRDATDLIRYAASWTERI